MQSRNKGNVQGIDVSHWQGKINWQQVKADGREFAFIKATQGTARVDPRFYENAKGARGAGLLVGAYHFMDAITVQAAKQQATHFAETMKKAGDVFELPPVMDYENNPGNLNKATINVIALAFLNEVERLTGCRPMIYTGNAFAVNFDTSLGSYPLWIARYSNTRVPDDRAAWKRWTIWQFSDSGKVPGISGNVDLNEFDGTLNDLKAWAKKMKQKEDAAAVSDKVKVIVDGKKIKDGKLVDGVTYVPLRDVGEALGAKIGWDQNTKTATLSTKV
ncbi:GH25 family lysozyme [Paenibacillus sp. Dod16]|uniref:GH25 family lysozyme n=1 Tax=Paenibacillus sp. Dod16 TaxID=3416392 RepID=UPI003CF7CCB0